MSAQSPVRCAIAGIGGFAASHHEVIAKMEQAGEVRLLATCDPSEAAVADGRKRWDFGGRNVRVYSDCDAMLAVHAAELDYVILSTPIPLHAGMHRLACAARIPSYIEKPPTLDPAELEQMIARESAAVHQSVVGFNFIVEEQRIALKQRLLANEFGKLLEVRLDAWRPRGFSYFRRNDWAGKLRSADGRLLLDSCVGNASAHYVHNVLFWAGAEGCFNWGLPATVQAGLYRAHDIEGADTFFIGGTTADGVQMRLALTHACTGKERMCETLITEEAVIHYVTGSHYEVLRQGKAAERVELPPTDLKALVAQTHRSYIRYLRGQALRPATTLADSRAFVLLNGLSYVSAGQIMPFPADCVSHVAADGDSFIQVDGMGNAVADFLQRGLWPGRGWGCGTIPRPVHALEINRLEQTVSRMQQERAALSGC